MNPIRLDTLSIAKDRRPLLELRADQVEANRGQVAGVCRPDDPEPRWVVGDSGALVPGLDLPDGAQFVFSCPPYGDLETYSDDPADLSTMDERGFLDAHAAIIRAAVDRLDDDAFAVWVVGDYRRRDGTFVGFPEATVAAGPEDSHRSEESRVVDDPRAPTPVDDAGGGIYLKRDDLFRIAGVELVDAGVDYHAAVEARVGGVLLDPHYEAKCARFLRPGDLLWIVGIRQTEVAG